MISHFTKSGNMLGKRTTMYMPYSVRDRGSISHFNTNVRFNFIMYDVCYQFSISCYKDGNYHNFYMISCMLMC